MRTRCNNPKDRQYKNYGGRGITVCERWTSFDLFLEDMGRRPSLKHSIDRINNSLGYAPENCRWATAVEQNQNTRKNVKITINGITKLRIQWLREFDVSESTYGDRIKKMGMTPEQALTTPPMKKNRQFL